LLVLNFFSHGSKTLADLGIVNSRVSIIFRHRTLSRTPLEEWSSLRT